MLSLYVNGQAVELPEDFSISWNTQSPIFSDVGSYSYPFRLKYSTRTAAILGFRHRIENTTDPFLALPTELRWNGITFFNGTLKVRVANKDYFEGMIYEGDGDFYYKIKDMDLQNVDFGDMTFANEDAAMTYINGCLNSSYPTRPVAFPWIHNDVYFDPPSVDPSQLDINLYWYDGTGIHKLTQDNNRTVIIPMLYFKYVMSKVFNHLGYTLDDQVLSEKADYNNLMLYNSVSINSLMEEFSYNLTHWLFNLHVPRLSMKDFLKGFKTFFNSPLFIYPQSHVAKFLPVDTIIKSDDLVDFSRNIISLSTEMDDQIRGFTFKMSLDGDDAKQSEFLSIEEDYVGALKGAVENVSDLPLFPIGLIGELRWVHGSGHLYKCFQNGWQIENTQIYKKLFSRYLYKSGEESIDIKFSSLSGAGNANTMPVECGNRMANWKNITPRLFFLDKGYIGDVLKHFGKCKTNNVTLFFNDDYPRTLFDYYYKSYADFRIAAKPVKCVKQSDFLELRDLDFSIKHMIFGNRYLIKDRQVTIKRNKILPATYNMFTV